MEEGIKCECAVAGIMGKGCPAAQILHDLLYQLSHRGEHFAGMSVQDDEGKIRLERRPGLSSVSFTPEVLAELPGCRGIAHGRYATAGPVTVANAQPHLSEDPLMALCANGDVIPSSYRRLRSHLAQKGVYFNGDNDGELLLHYLAYRIQQGFNLVDAMDRMMGDVVGAFSGALIFDGKLATFRDPLGIRPLSIGRIGESWVVASETCAFDVIQAKYVRDVEPGELVIFDDDGGITSHQLRTTKMSNRRYCIFELIYFSRPDSKVFGLPVQKFRQILGSILGKKYPADGDVVISVPDSSNAAALGYAQGSGLDLGIGLIRNHQAGRTFTRPNQASIILGLLQKFNTVYSELEGKRVVVVDDSIVRGNTMKALVQLLRNAGSNEVHLRIISPPVRHSCFYGIATPDKKKLIAHSKDIGQVCNYVGADSLFYVTIGDLMEAIEMLGGNPSSFCYACFNGVYPTEL